MGAARKGIPMHSEWRARQELLKRLGVMVVALEKRIFHWDV